MSITDIPTRNSNNANASADINTLNSNDADLGTNTPDGYRNYIIDGDFTYWTLGASFTSTGYSADMWSWSEQSGAGTVSKQNNIDSDVDSFFLRLNMSNAAANTYIEEKLRGCEYVAGKSLICFARMKSSSGVSSLRFLVSRFDGSGDNAEQTDTISIPSDDTWAWYRFDLDVSDTSGLTITSGSFTRLRLQNTANELYTLDFDKVRVIEKPENLQDDEIPEWVKKDQDNRLTRMLIAQYLFPLAALGYYRMSYYTANNLRFTVPLPLTLVQNPSLIDANGDPPDDGVDLEVRNLDGTVDSGYTWGLATSGRTSVDIDADQNAHGLTDGTAYVKANCFLDARY